MSFHATLQRLRDAVGARQRGAPHDVRTVRRDDLIQLLEHFDRLGHEARGRTYDLVGPVQWCVDPDAFLAMIGALEEAEAALVMLGGDTNRRKPQRNATHTFQPVETVALDIVRSAIARAQEVQAYTTYRKPNPGDKE